MPHGDCSFRAYRCVGATRRVADGRLSRMLTRLLCHNYPLVSYGRPDAGQRQRVLDGLLQRTTDFVRCPLSVVRCQIGDSLAVFRTDHGQLTTDASQRQQRDLQENFTMNVESSEDGPEEFTASDRLYAGSRFSEVRDALFANPYYKTWGGPGESLIPVYEVTLGRLIAWLLLVWQGLAYLQAARRTLESQADLRWGPDRRGVRRIVHPNGVCLTGTWEIDESPEGREYSGYFKKGSRALIVGRYSNCCTGTRSGELSIPCNGWEALSDDRPGSSQPYRTANFFTQEDLGGGLSPKINDVDLRNAPDRTRSDAVLDSRSSW